MIGSHVTKASSETWLKMTLPSCFEAKFSPLVMILRPYYNSIFRSFCVDDERG